MNVLEPTTLPDVLRKHRSIFVVGVRAKFFWERDVEAYPFHQGALLVSTPEDELRFPNLFLHMCEGNLIVSRCPEWFGRVWEDHLCGVVESKPPDFHLPEYSRPSCALPIKW